MRNIPIACKQHFKKTISHIIIIILAVTYTTETYEQTQLLSFTARMFTFTAAGEVQDRAEFLF